MSSSARSKPSASPADGAASPATAPASHATGRDLQTATCASAGILRYTDSAPRLTAHWDNTWMVRGKTVINPLKSLFDLTLEASDIVFIVESHVIYFNSKSKCEQVDIG